MDKQRLLAGNVMSLISKVEECILAGIFEERKAILETERCETNKLNNQDFKSYGFYVGVPILAIIIVETMFCFGMIKVAIWINAAILMGLFFSIKQIKNREVRKTCQALILLPLIRLISLSMPIFSGNTIFSIFIIYIPIVVLAILAIFYQQLTREEMGINLKKIWLYLPLSILISFGLIVGEYKLIQTDYLIPDLSPLRLIKLTVVMVFFVGLVEEIIFRSILQTRLNKIFGVRGGILLSSVLFGFMHSGYGTFYEVLYISLIGVIIGYIFYKTRSLPLVTLVHGFMNVFLFGFIPLLGLGLGVF